MKGDRELAIVAIGGNAIVEPGQQGTIPQQVANIEETCRSIVELVLRGYRTVVTHGNGPQVGAQLLRSDLASSQVYPHPLDVCVADTQGSMGYMIQNALQRTLDDNQRSDEVGSLVTQVVVDEDDPAFAEPTKPVGPYYSAEDARRKREERGWTMARNGPRGWRRVVASPEPLEIVEERLIRAAVDREIIAITLGGGGIPVVRRANRLYGIEAVVDKDRASSLLARSLGADLFVIATDVEKVFLDYREPDEAALDRLEVAEARRHLAEGQFPPGTMGPKVRAAVDFVEAEGGRAIITSTEKLGVAVEGETGTHFVPDP